MGHLCEGLLVYLWMVSAHAAPMDERLPAALEQLSSGDVLTQNEGVATAIAIGAAATPALVSLLEDPLAQRRSQAMYALSVIGDPAAIPAFRRGLADPDEAVRASAAVGLARLRTEDALAACIQTLDDAPDMLHLDFTPAVTALAEMGRTAAAALLTPLASPDPLTRLHAQRALEGIVYRSHGWVPGRGFPSPDDDRKAADEWRARGDYNYDAELSLRSAAIESWRRTLRDEGLIRR